MRWMLVLLLVGCSGEVHQDDARATKRAAQQQAARALADQPPKVKVYRLDAGELTVIDTATVSEGGFPDSQKCFLWRDSEYRTASLQCPAAASGDLPDVTP